MERVDLVRTIFLVNEEHDATTDRDKVGMRDLEAASIRKPDGKRREVRTKALPDMLKVKHA